MIRNEGVDGAVAAVAVVRGLIKARAKAQRRRSHNLESLNPKQC